MEARTQRRERPMTASATPLGHTARWAGARFPSTLLRPTLAARDGVVPAASLPIAQLVSLRMGHVSFVLAGRCR
jgi:hypothetical protein